MKTKSRLILLSAGLVALITATGLLRPARGGATPAAAEPSPAVIEVAPPDATPSSDTLLAMSRIEGLLRLGHPEAALALAAGVPDSDPSANAIRPLRAWALFSTEAFTDVVELLGDDLTLDDELRYLKGTALLRSDAHEAGLTLLRELWWGEPQGVWGQAALRVLATVGARGSYTRAEAEAVSRIVPAVTFDTGRKAEVVPRSTLEALRRGAGKGRLASEVEYALGVSLLADEKFSEAVSALSAALDRTKDRALKRVIELRLGEAERRRGAYAAAQRHFAKVATGPTDRFAGLALAASGQMAIEFRRYPEARALFEAQLVKNPIGAARHEALWGLGWVSFRTGDLRAARRFFLALFAEAPYGALAPRALYWGARAIDDLGDHAQAAVEMALIEGRFPVDYYAFRARTWRGEAPLPPLVASERFGADARVTQVKAVFAAGMLARAKKAVRELKRDWTALGPADLAALEEVAVATQDTQLAAGLEEVRWRRFPDEAPAVDRLGAQFPKKLVALLAGEAVSQRIDPELPAAVALQESRFNPRALSPVGAVGLMQIMPATARGLMREESRTGVKSGDLLDPAVNARLGVRYLGRMLRSFDRHVEYALAAYNAGPGAVTRWREAHGELPADIFVEEIPYGETRDYVRRVLANLETYRFVSTFEPRETHEPTAELARVAEGR